MVCIAKRVAIARMAELAAPLTVPAHVLMVGKALIVPKEVAKIQPHMDLIVHSSVLVTETIQSCKFFCARVARPFFLFWVRHNTL